MPSSMIYVKKQNPCEAQIENQVECVITPESKCNALEQYGRRNKEIKACHKIGKSKSGSKTIILQAINRKTCKQALYNKKLNNKKLEQTKKTFFISENLSPYNQNLLFLARELNPLSVYPTKWSTHSDNSFECAWPFWRVGAWVKKANLMHNTYAANGYIFIKRSPNEPRIVNLTKMICMLTLYVQQNALVEFSKHDLYYFRTSHFLSQTLQNYKKLKN